MQARSDDTKSADANGANDVSAPSPRERLRGLVSGILASHGIDKPFSDDDTLAEVGLASVDMVSLMLAVENEFRIEIPQGEITADVFRSVSTLVAMLRRVAPAG